MRQQESKKARERKGKERERKGKEGRKEKTKKKTKERKESWPENTILIIENDMDKGTEENILSCLEIKRALVWKNTGNQVKEYYL